MSQKTLPVGVTGGKFNQNGQAIQFPGNTVLCHISGTPLFRRLEELYRQFAENPLNGDLYTLLPPESYHITLFDGVCRKQDGTWFWPTSFHREGSLDECTDYCREKIITSGIISPEKVFKVTGVKDSLDTVGLIAEVAEPYEARVRTFRDRLSDVLEIRRGNHDHYLFHITLAYFIRHPNEAERRDIQQIIQSFTSNLTEKEKQLRLDEAEFCQYQDMTAFEPVWRF